MTILQDAPATFDQERYDAGRFDGLIESLDRTGDTKIMFDRNNPTEVEVAKAAFEAHLKKGGMAYKAEGKDGTKGERIKKFDPTVERMILVPQLVGG